VNIADCRNPHIPLVVHNSAISFRKSLRRIPTKRRVAQIGKKNIDR
jgi:hypothetical protein